MSGFFAELKRRNVYRVAAAYAVAAWLLLQIVNNVAPILDLPPWIARAFLLLLVVGFSIALVVAWMFELTPEGLRRTTPDASADAMRGRVTRTDWVLCGALATVIVLIAWQQLAMAWRDAAPVPQQVTAAPPAVPLPAGVSIAVLPFVNLSGDASQEFFSDGITEEITSALTQIPDLQVVARTSAFQFKGDNRNIQAIGETLHATHVIEGSVRKAGDRIRISAQLISADNGTHLWAENYDRQLTDIFAVQEEIAQAIAVALRIPLGLGQTGTLVRSRAKDNESYETYLRAKAGFRSRGMLPLSETVALLEQVVARDPDYAPAWALLGITRAALPTFDAAVASGAVDQARGLVQETLPKAEAAAQRAIQLDPMSAEGYLALALLRVVKRDWLAASDFYARALALDPGNPDALHAYSVMLADLGYVKEALPIRERLLLLEPFIPVFNSVTAAIVWTSGDVDRAIAMFSAENTRAYTLSVNRLAHIYAAQGQYEKAADTLLTTPAGFYLSGTVEAAARVLRAGPDSGAALPDDLRLGYLGWVYPLVGAPERFYDLPKAMMALGYLPPNGLSMWWLPHFSALRKMPEFRSYMRTVGAAAYWRARGWPDLCRPVGANDFVCD